MLGLTRKLDKKNLRGFAFFAAADLVLGSICWACNIGYPLARGPTLLSLRPSPIYWYGEVGFLAGMVGSMLYDRAGYKRMTKRQWRVEVLWMCLFAILPLMGVRKHARLTDSALIEQPMFALREETHPYSEVTDVMLAYYWISGGGRGGYTGPSTERGLFIKFRDGTEWSAMESALRVDEALSTRAANLISARTQLPVQYARPDIVIGEPPARRVR
jgi:hypothetical protein